jgi:hypothetical protein
MREKLSEYLGTFSNFSGTVANFGMKKGSCEETLLLAQVRDHRGNEVTDHTWITLTKDLKRICPCYGDRITFEAFVEPYKSKLGDNLGLSRIQNVRITYPNKHVSVIA